MAKRVYFRMDKAAGKKLKPIHSAPSLQPKTKPTSFKLSGFLLAIFRGSSVSDLLLRPFAREQVCNLLPIVRFQNRFVKMGEVLSKAKLAGLETQGTRLQTCSRNYTFASLATTAMNRPKRQRLTASVLTFVMLCQTIAGVFMPLNIFKPFDKPLIADAAWFSTGGTWSYRKAITIDYHKVAADLVYFPVLVNIVNDASVGAHALTNGYDIRFALADGTPLNFEREDFAITGGNASGNFWVRIPALSSSQNTTIYMYYGKSDATDGQNVTDTWDENGAGNFKGVYHLKEAGTGSTNDYKDSTSNANNGGQASNEPTVNTSGKIGKAESFDGVDDSVNVTSLSNISNNYTVESWIYLTAKGTWAGVRRAPLVAGASGSYFENPILSTSGNDGGAQYVMLGGCNGIQNGPFTSTAVPLNSWVHLAVTVDSSNVWRAYFNGVQDATAATFQATIQGVNLFIGGGVGRPFQGSIDEFRISNTSRSPQWISTEYNNQNSPSTFYSLGSEVSASLWLSGYSYRKAITVTNQVASALNSYQVKLTIDTAALYSAGKMKIDGSDLRFADVNGVDIPYWIESGINTSSTIIWIKTDLASSQAKTVYVYYGNSGASAVSSGGSVFELFDDMNASDSSKWTYSGPDIVYSNGYVALGPGSPSQGAMQTIATIPLSTIYDIKWKVTPMSTNGNWTPFFGVAGETWFYEADDVRLYCYAGGANAGWNEYFSDNTWYTSKIISLSSSSNFQRDPGATMRTHDGSYSAAKFYFSGGSIQSARMYIDWVHIRKYAVIEPALSSWGSEQGLALSNWQNRKAITIDYHQVSADLTNFPILINLTTDTALAAHAQTTGNDILFTSSTTAWPTGTTSDKLAHEIESYNTSNGSLQAWVKIPALSHTQNTVIYMYYGNNNAGALNTTAVWDSNFKGVWHLGESPAGAAPQMKDSTSNAYNGTSTGSMASGQSVAGPIGKALSFDGSDDYVDFGNIITLSDTNLVANISFWSKGAGVIINTERAVSGTGDARVTVNGDGTLSYYVDDSTVVPYSHSITSTIAAANVNDWNFYSLNINGPANSFGFRINGLSETKTFNASSGDTSFRNIEIGRVRNYVYGTTYYAISVEEAHISTINRSSDWISTEYNNQSAPGTFYTLGGEQAIATNYSLSAPSPAAGPVNTASQNFTVTPNGAYTGTITVTPSGGGLSTPISFTFIDSNVPQTFSVTPTTTGTVTFTSTNSGTLTDPSAITYSSVSVSVSPNSIIQASTNNTVILTGVSTSWTAGTPGVPTFTHTGGTGASITNQTITDPTHATLTINAGSATGTLTLTDPSTNVTIDISVVSSTDAIITAFDFANPATTGAIDHINHTVTLNVPYGTSLINLTPTISTSAGATVSPDTGISHNFATPVTYTVTAQDGINTQAYTVSVNTIPTATLSKSQTSILENAGTATITAALSNAYYQDVTVSLAFSGTAADTINYTKSASSIVIPTGSTTGSIILTGVNNNNFETPERTILIDIDTITNGTKNINSQPQTIDIKEYSSSGSGFIASVKPIIPIKDGQIDIDNLPSGLMQMAISTSLDFKNVSWEKLNKDRLKELIGSANTTYIKFRTSGGGVSDVIVGGGKSGSIDSGSDSSANPSASKTLNDGDIVKTIDNPDVYIIKYKNNKQYKRLILSPSVFISYHHLKWENIKIVSQTQLDAYATSNFVKETIDTIIYLLFPSGDKGERKKLDTSKTYDTDSVYEINRTDRDSYRLVK